MLQRLLTTTAVVVALGFVQAPQSFATSADAGAETGLPKLTINGDAKAAFAGTQQTKGDVRSGQGLGHALLCTGGVDFKAEGKFRENVDYSLVIGLTGDMNPGNVGTQGSVRKSYVEISTPYGAVLAGNNESAADMVSSGAANVLGGEGGWNGTFLDVVTQSTGTVVGDSLSADPGAATSIVYSTPDDALKGVKVVVGFTPNTTHYGFMSPTDNQNQNINNNFRYMFGDPEVIDIAAGTAVKKLNFDMRHADPSNGSFDLNAISGGVTYTYGQPEQGSFAISLAGVMGKSKYHGNSKAYNDSETSTFAQTGVSNDIESAANALGTPAAGEAKTAKLNDTRAYQVGFNAGYRNFELGVTYTDNRKSRIAKRFTDEGTKYNAGKIISGALSYTYGDIKVSGGVSQGKRAFAGQETKADVRTIALDYTLTSGLKFCAEFNHATFKTCQRAKDIASATYGTASIDDNQPRALIVSASINF